MIIELQKVGRGKVTRRFHCEDGLSDDRAAAAVEAEASRHLMSGDVEAILDPVAAPRKWEICAGGRTVGAAQVVYDQGDPETVKSAVEETQRRGQLTERIREASIEFFGHEITVKELRLIVHVHFLLTNSRPIDYAKIDAEESDIIREWLNSGWLVNDGKRLRCTKGFWDASCQMVWLGYVDLK